MFDLFWLNWSIGFATAVSALLVIALAVWVWHTRPSRTYVPAYRRVAPVTPVRTTVDGRRRLSL